MKNYEHATNLSIYIHRSQFSFIWYFQYFIYFYFVAAYSTSLSILRYSMVSLITSWPDSESQTGYPGYPISDLLYFSCWWIILVSLLCSTICESFIHHVNWAQSFKTNCILHPSGFCLADIALLDTMFDTTNDTFR